MEPSSTCFITAVDTDAGKSFLAGLLYRALRRRGVAAAALKPVACGVNGEGVNPDVARLRALQPEAEEINFHTTRAPRAPLFAGPVARGELLDWCRRKTARPGVTLIEGVGGLMVPLAEGFTQLDWILSLPKALVVLVVPARLGCLSQMLTHLSLLDALDRRPWLVVNCIDQDALSFGKECLQAADSWFPWVPAALLPPEADDCPALTDRLCRPPAPPVATVRPRPYIPGRPPYQAEVNPTR